MSEAQMEAPSFIDEVLSAQALFCWLPPPVTPDAADGSTWLLKINYPLRESSRKKERSGNGGGRGFLCSAGLRDVSRSGIAGMPGRDPRCRQGKGNGLPSSRAPHRPSFRSLPTAPAWQRAGGNECTETDLLKKPHPKGFWPRLARMELGYPEPTSWGGGGSRGWLEREGEEKRSAYKPAAASGWNSGFLGPAVDRKSCGKYYCSYILALSNNR